MSVFTWDDDEDGGECPWELMSDDPDARADDRGCFDYHQRAA